MSQPIPQQPTSTPDALLKFTVQGHALTSNPVSPSLTIDGHTAPTVVAGTTAIPIVSGRHQLRASSWWLVRFGHAAIDVDIAPGESVEVFYASPYQQLVRRGSIGLTPQTRRGLAGLVGLVVLAVVVAVVVIEFAIPAILAALLT